MAAEVKRKDSRQGEQEALGDSAATPASPHGICHMHVVISISRGSTRRALLASAWLATDCVHLPRGTRAMHLTRFHALRRFTAAIGWDSGCAALGVMEDGRSFIFYLLRIYAVNLKGECLHYLPVAQAQQWNRRMIPARAAGKGPCSSRPVAPKIPVSRQLLQCLVGCGALSAGRYSAGLAVTPSAFSVQRSMLPGGASEICIEAVH